MGARFIAVSMLHSFFVFPNEASLFANVFEVGLIAWSGYFGVMRGNQ